MSSLAADAPPIGRRPPFGHAPSPPSTRDWRAASRRGRGHTETPPPFAAAPPPRPAWQLALQPLAVSSPLATPPPPTPLLIGRLRSEGAWLHPNPTPSSSMAAGAPPCAAPIGRRPPFSPAPSSWRTAHWPPPIPEGRGLHLAPPLSFPPSSWLAPDWPAGSPAGRGHAQTPPPFAAPRLHSAAGAAPSARAMGRPAPLPALLLLLPALRPAAAAPPNASR